MDNGNIGGPIASSGRRLPQVSRRGVICYLLFLAFTVVGRLLYPYGDEPDFVIRSVQANSPEVQSIWNPYRFGNAILPEPNLTADCSVLSGPLTLGARIQGRECTEPVESLLRRFIWVILLTSPIGFAIIFRNRFSRVVRAFGVRHPNDEWRLRIDAVSLSILLPSSVYYFGVFSVEPLVLTLGYLVFLIAGSWLFFGSLLIYAATIDMGNTVVMLICYACIMSLWIVYKKGGPWLCAGVAIAGLAVAYLLNFALVSSILAAASKGPLSLKGAALLSMLAQSDFYSNYPLLLRPVVSFMTFCFMTAGFVKVPLLYLVVGTVALTLILRSMAGMVREHRVVTHHGKRQSVAFSHARFGNVALVGAILSIAIIGILLPPYVNFKYYAFLVPFFLVSAVRYYRIRSIMFFCSAAQVLVFGHLLYYRYA